MFKFGKQRMIRSEVFKQLKFARMPFEVFKFMYALMSHADDHGNVDLDMESFSRLVDLSIEPVKPSTMYEWIDYLSNESILDIYVVKDKRYAAIVGWLEKSSPLYQYIHPSNDSKWRNPRRSDSDVEDVQAPVRQRDRVVASQSDRGVPRRTAAQVTSRVSRSAGDGDHQAGEGGLRRRVKRVRKAARPSAASSEAGQRPQVPKKKSLIEVVKRGEQVLRSADGSDRGSGISRRSGAVGKGQVVRLQEDRKVRRNSRRDGATATSTTLPLGVLTSPSTKPAKKLPKPLKKLDPSPSTKKALPRAQGRSQRAGEAFNPDRYLSKSHLQLVELAKKGVITREQLEEVRKMQWFAARPYLAFR